MKETDALVRIQEIDLSLMRYRRTLMAMPQAKKLSAIKQAKKKLAQEKSKVVGLRKDAEMDLQENDRAHERLLEIVLETQERFDADTASYREVADLEAQLTSLAKRIEKREFNHKELTKKLERVQATEQNVLAMEERLDAEEAAQRQSLHDSTADIERAVRMLTAEREEVARSVSQEVMASYVAASKRFKGLAVERLNGNIPSICCVAIAPSAYGDVVRGPDITECPYCHRLLVTTQEREES